MKLLANTHVSLASAKVEKAALLSFFVTRTKEPTWASDQGSDAIKLVSNRRICQLQRVLGQQGRGLEWSI